MPLPTLVFHNVFLNLSFVVSSLVRLTCQDLLTDKRYLIKSLYRVCVCAFIFTPTATCLAAVIHQLLQSDRNLSIFQFMQSKSYFTFCMNFLFNRCVFLEDTLFHDNRINGRSVAVTSEDQAMLWITDGRKLKSTTYEFSRIT